MTNQKAYKKPALISKDEFNSRYHLNSRMAHALRLCRYPTIPRQISVPPAKPTLQGSPRKTPHFGLLLRDVFPIVLLAPLTNRQLSVSL